MRNMNMIKDLIALVVSTILALIFIYITERIVLIGFILILVIVSIYYSRYSKDKKRLHLQRKKLDDQTTIMSYKHQQQSTKLETVVANIEIPILLIDEDGHITTINGAMKHLLSKAYFEGMTFQELFKNEPLLLDIINQGYLYEKRFVTHLTLEQHFYQVLFSPIILQEQFQGGAFIFQDVTVLKQTEIMQKQFIADASHELKTPMSAILGSLTILKSDGFDTREVYEDFLTVLIKEVERMNDLIHDLSELTKFSSPQVQMRYEKVNVYELVEDTIKLYRQKAKDKQIKLLFDYHGNHTVIIDKRKVQTILTNLISNALRYTDIGYIHIQIDVEEDITILIEDTGIGMSQEDLEHIFERFYRVEKARSRDTGGTGLGLCIVESIVSKYQGVIEVSSQVDRGTMFKIILPNKED